MDERNERSVIARATVHLAGGIRPGGGPYVVNPDSEYIAERIAAGHLVVVGDDTADVAAPEDVEELVDVPDEEADGWAV